MAACVYRHIRLDKKQVFYVGIASLQDGFYYRAFDKTKRTKFWKRIASKGYEVEIILQDLSWEEACGYPEG